MKAQRIEIMTGRYTEGLIFLVISCFACGLANAQQQCTAATCPWLNSVEQGFCANADTFEAVARQSLYPLVTVNKCPCNGNSLFQPYPLRPCTEVKGLRQGTVQALRVFLSEYGSPVILTGGSEPGHTLGEDETSFSHDNGYKVDLVDSFFCESATSCNSRTTFYAGLSAFIQSRFNALGQRGGDTCDIWGMDIHSSSPGPQFALEAPPCAQNQKVPITDETAHWDIAFPPNSIASIGVTVTGTGTGRVDSMPRLITNCTSTCNYVPFTRGTNVDLVASPDPNSVFKEWIGLSTLPTITVFADGTPNFTAVIDTLPSPPTGNPGCWTAAPIGWFWTCPTQPPPGGGNPPQQGCWTWKPLAGVAGGWIYEDCNPDGTDGGGPVATFGGAAVGPVDPNDKAGSQGVGLQQYVSGLTPLRYAVFYGNEATASAAAQKVVVTDQLNVSTEDLTTFNLGPISLPSQLVFLPPGPSDFSTTVDLRPSNNILVAVNTHLDTSTGLLTWVFQSLDPATNQPPTDPTVGFLPPGAGGSTFFTVMPKQGLSTNTQVQNQATVVFDTNPPMNTPTWANTLDNTAPISQVGSLPATEFSLSFPVTWSGTDVGAGIQDFTVYVSDNGGPFTAFQKNTPATSATFTGQVGHTYKFYSIARDLVGNVEGAKTTAEATTQVTTDTTPPVTTAVASPGPNGAGWNNSNVTIMLNSTDSEPGGTGIKQIQWSLAGAQLGSSTVPGNTTAVIISTEGTTTLSYFGTDNAGNIESARTLTVMLDKTPPSITGMRTPAANANGWNNSPVTVSFQCSDSLSGLAAGSPPTPTVLSGEGAGQSVTGTCTDVAGNSATSTVSGINIDKTPPVITASASPVTLWPPNGKLVIVTESGTMSDNLSGVSSGTAVFAVKDSYGLVQPSGPVSLAPNGTYSFTISLEARRDGQDQNGRLYTIVVSAQDNAGNPSSSTTTVIVPHDQGN
jgi:hypothetical protein